MEEKLLDTVEAAAFLDLSRESVSRLVLVGKLPSQKFGRARLIREADLITFKAIDRKPGRPPKPKDEAKASGAAEVITTAETPVTEAEPVEPKRKRTVKAAKAGTKKAKPKK